MTRCPAIRHREQPGPARKGAATGKPVEGQVERGSGREFPRPVSTTLPFVGRVRAQRRGGAFARWISARSRPPPQHPPQKGKQGGRGGFNFPQSPNLDEMGHRGRPSRAVGRKFPNFRKNDLDEMTRRPHRKADASARRRRNPRIRSSRLRQSPGAGSYEDPAEARPPETPSGQERGGRGGGGRSAREVSLSPLEGENGNFSILASSKC